MIALLESLTAVVCSATRYEQALKSRQCIPTPTPVSAHFGTAVFSPFKRLCARSDELEVAWNEAAELNRMFGEANAHREQYEMEHFVPLSPLGA